MSIGDLVIVHREKEYRVGDIVVFDSGGLSVTHRILEKAQEGFVTKGDANNVPDKELLSEKSYHRKGGCCDSYGWEGCTIFEKSSRNDVDHDACHMAYLGGGCGQDG